MLAKLLGFKGYLITGLICAALAAAGAGVASYKLAWRLQDGAIAKLKEADAQAQAASIVAALQRERSQTKASADAGKVAETHQAEIRTEIKVVHDKVPVYVTEKADADCILPVGAFRLLDAAAAGADPDAYAGVDAPGQPNDAPSGVDCSRFVDLVAEDFGRYRQISRQLNDILDLAEKQQALAPSP